MRRGILLIIIAAFLVVFVGLDGNGQTKSDDAKSFTTCLVGDEQEDKARVLFCDGFEPTARSTWPPEWEDFKSKGDKVRAKVVDGRLIPIAASCEERIKKRFNQRIGLHPTLSEITPSDCVHLSTKQVEAVTKQ